MFGQDSASFQCNVVIHCVKHDDCSTDDNAWGVRLGNLLVCFKSTYDHAPDYFPELSDDNFGDNQNDLGDILLLTRHARPFAAYLYRSFFSFCPIHFSEVKVEVNTISESCEEKHRQNPFLYKQYNRCHL